MKIILLITLLSLTGCTALHDRYKETGWYTPDGFNYTLARERESGALTDEFGLSWTLK